MPCPAREPPVCVILARGKVDGSKRGAQRGTADVSSGFNLEISDGFERWQVDSTADGLVLVGEASTTMGGGGGLTDWSKWPSRSTPPPMLDSAGKERLRSLGLPIMARSPEITAKCLHSRGIRQHARVLGYKKRSQNARERHVGQVAQVAKQHAPRRRILQIRHGDARYAVVCPRRRAAQRRAEVAGAQLRDGLDVGQGEDAVERVVDEEERAGDYGAGLVDVEVGLAVNLDHGIVACGWLVEDWWSVGQSRLVL